jgi:glutathione S-transferase
MAPKLHLYLSPGACSLAPHILLHEAGLPFTFTIINVLAGFPPEHLHLNPKGQVPFLHLDSETITEVPAIITAIAQLVPEKHLLGKSGMDVVRSYEWMNWISTTLHRQAYGAWFRPQWFVEEPELYDGVKKKAVNKITECYEFIEEKLEGKAWAVGEEFSAVDAYLFVFYWWGPIAGIKMKEAFPKYTRLAEEVAKRPAVVKALEEEEV